MAGLFDDLAAAGVRRVDDESVDPVHRDFLRRKFEEEVRPLIAPVLLDAAGDTPFLKNHASLPGRGAVGRGGHVAKGSWTPDYAFLEVPSDVVGRFCTLPDRGADTK